MRVIILAFSICMVSVTWAGQVDTTDCVATVESRDVSKKDVNQSKSVKTRSTVTRQ
jgi:hypothetical protein